MIRKPRRARKPRADIANAQANGGGGD